MLAPASLATQAQLSYVAAVELAVDDLNALAAGCSREPDEEREAAVGAHESTSSR